MNDIIVEVKLIWMVKEILDEIILMSDMISFLSLYFLLHLVWRPTS